MQSRAKATFTSAIKPNGQHAALCVSPLDQCSAVFIDSACIECAAVVQRSASSGFPSSLVAGCHDPVSSRRVRHA